MLLSQAKDGFERAGQPDHYVLLGATTAATPAAPVQKADGTVYRLFNPWSSEHLFTVDPQEKDNLVSLGWKLEESLGKASLDKGEAVYRLYNPWTGEHHFTMKKDEVDARVADGWKDEGVKFYSVDKAAKGAVAVVSLFNPYATEFTHTYTTNDEEVAKCVADGWKNEGPKWYVVK